MPTLGPIEAPEDFESDTELLCEGSYLQKIIIANNSAEIQIAEAGERGLSGAAVPFTTSMPLPPGIYDMARRIERIRFRRLTNVKPIAMVTVITTP